MRSIVHPAPRPPAWAALTAWIGAVLGRRGDGDGLLDAARACGLGDVAAAGQVLDLVVSARGAGLSAATLVLPRPGDPLGVPGPIAVVRAVVDAGAVIVLHGDGDTAVLLFPGPQGSLDVRTGVALGSVRSTWPTPTGMRRDILEAVTAATQEFERVAAMRAGPPGPAQAVLAAAPPVLPPGLDSHRRSLLARGLLLLATIEEARRTTAVTGTDQGRIAATLADLDRTARRAVCAAVSGPPGAPVARFGA